MDFICVHLRLILMQLVWFSFCSRKHAMENESKPRLSGSIITLVVILALLTGLIGGIIGSYITGLFNNRVTQDKNISWKAVQAPSLGEIRHSTAQCHGGSRRCRRKK